MGKPLAAPTVTPAAPTLPKADASGLRIAPVAAAPVGGSASTGFSIELPISPGRGYAPQLALSSGGGNGIFGWGWNINIPAIRRRFDHGMPDYQRSDEFLGPDGEVLIEIGSTNSAMFPTSYTARRYMPRKEGEFNRISFLQSHTSMSEDFWVVEQADGSMLIFGMSDAGRVYPQADTSLVAEWLLQESVTADGQHIYYQYTRLQDPVTHLGQATRYLTAIHYGNVEGAQLPFFFDDINENPETGPAQAKWLFTLLFDYSKPTPRWLAPAPYADITAAPWNRRLDSHTSYGYGYPLPAEYLCRQVLMYHNLDSNKQLSGSGTPTLISRLLMDYEQTPAASRLMGTQLMAYDSDGAWTFLPFIDIEWTPDFIAPTDSSCWQPLDQPMALPNSGVAPEQDPILYSEADIYSEGAAGLLHRIGNCWYYRRTVRDQRPGAPARAITYGPRKLLDRVPVISAAADSLFMDINGDGRLESVKTGAGGARGYHTMQADRTWSNFIPVQTLPTEIGAPYAVFGNMHGSGLPDLFVLSPTSVRYYINQSDDTKVAFSAPREVAQDDGILLPIPGRNPREWINFADVLGSGQPHLVRLRYDSLTYWPWLGNGRFGAPITMTASLPFDLATFDPARVSFLSLFGPQAPDLVYADVNDIKIFPNQCGNGYDFANMVKIPYPDGVHRGTLTDIHFSDMAGTGGTSIVLTQPYGNVLSPYGYTGYGATRYWRVDLNTAVPYQLTALDNNAGARTEVTWRSSIQDWVDEKVETNDAALTNRPGARMAVDQIATIDYIANLQRISTFKYRDGIWDGHEREARGYRYLESSNATFSYSIKPGFVPTAKPEIASVTVRQWLHAGRATDTQRATFYGKPYSDSLGSFCGTPNTDATAYQYLDTRVTSPSSSVTDAAPWFDTAYTGTDANTLWWLHRSLAGSPLRTETYDARAVPLSVAHNRWQVRLARPTSPYPIALPMPLETITYHYEGYATDPLITQSVEMDTDEYGFTTWKLDIAYPRQLQSSAANPYVDAALDSAFRIPFPVAGNGGAVVDNLAWTSTFDTQQTVLYLTESRFQAEHLDDLDYRLGILQADRQNVLSYATCAAAQAGGTGLHFEALSNLGNASCLLAPAQTRTLKGQNSYQYFTVFAPLVLLQWTKTALLSAADYQTLSGMTDADSLLATGGYQQNSLLLSVPGKTETDKVWTGQFGINIYTYTDEDFYSLKSQQQSSLLGHDGVAPITTFTWDDHYVLIKSATDPYGSVTSADAIDYRFLAPTTIHDLNMNKHQVQLDSLGRVIATSFSGTQLKEDGNGTSVELVGFDDLAAKPYDGNFGKGGTQTQATRVDYQVTTMMACVADAYSLELTLPDLAQQLLDARYAFSDYWSMGGEQYYFRSRGRAWLASNPTGPDYATTSMIQYFQMYQAATQPLNFSVQTADAYPGSAVQQLLLNTTIVDGLGRTLSNCIKVPGNIPTYTVNEFGNLDTDMANSAAAYAIRDYVQYGLDGQVLTRWPAFFLNQTLFVKYGQLPAATVPPDNYIYDAANREVRIITGRVSDRTGQPYERRTYYAPWLTLAQDENDIDDELDDAPGYTPPSTSLLARIKGRPRKKRSSRRR